MKTILTTILVLISSLTFSQKSVKVQTGDSSCVTILRNTFGCKEELNTNGVFTFTFCNKGRVVTNLASKREDIDYKIIKD
jgi:hypothetical protein